MDTGTNKRQNNNSNSENKPSIKNRDLAAQYGIGKSTCSEILAKLNHWLSINLGSKEATNKKSKKPVFVDIESAVALWVEHVIGNKQTLTGYLIQNKAKEFATLLNEDKFNTSNGWLHNFKKRHNIREYKRQNEADSAPFEELPEFRNEVSSETIRNCWCKMGIPPVELNNDHFPPQEFSHDEYLDDEREVHYLIEQLPINSNDLLPASEYIKIDNNLSSTKIPLNQEILAALRVIKSPTVDHLVDTSTAIAVTENSYGVYETLPYELKPIKTEILPVLSLNNRFNQ
ncbi:13058_t:CDS:2, partial [Dentiscutata erythropus]